MKEKRVNKKKTKTTEIINNTGDVSNGTKKENIFLDYLWIWVNIFVIIGIIVFYLIRLVYYYQIEHEPIRKKASLYETIVTEKNITKYNAGLYKDNDFYYYKGLNVNNYLYYSNNMWRIIKIDKDNVKVILDRSVTSLMFGANGDYNTSDIKNWLNLSDMEHSGRYYNSLNSPDIYLNKIDWCYGEVTETDDSCTDKVNDYIGLLSILEYNHAGGKKSYLNNQEYFWSINSKDNSPISIQSTGEISNLSSSGYNYYSYGVRPVVNIKATAVVFKGDGSISNPYVIENKEMFKLSDINIGGVVSYNNYLFRIIDKGNDYVHLAINKNIDNVGLNSGDTRNYLSNDFYNTFTNKDDFIDSAFYSGKYVNSYTDIYQDFYVSKIGLLSVNDFYINDTSDYYLSNHHTDGELTTYSVNGMGRLFIDDATVSKNVRPVISLRGDLTVEGGNGTTNNPYKVVMK